jgi:hypothetical protein
LKTSYKKLQCHFQAIEETAHQSGIGKKEPLGNYDWVTETNTWVYDLGYYKDYMDPTTFEIAFNSHNAVVSYDIVVHK